MKLYFVRHGESCANSEQIFLSKSEGWGLTARGMEQAQMLADSLADVGLSAIYCSPLLRAVQTAQVIGGRLEIIYHVDEGLREWDVGILEGQKYSEETWEQHDQVVAQWMQHGNYDAQIEGGESYSDIAARFMPLINRLENAHDGTDAKVLLISHSMTLACMLPLLLSSADRSCFLTQGVFYATPIVVELSGNKWICQPQEEESKMPWHNVWPTTHNRVVEVTR